LSAKDLEDIDAARAGAAYAEGSADAG